MGFYHGLMNTIKIRSIIVWRSREKPFGNGQVSRILLVSGLLSMTEWRPLGAAELRSDQGLAQAGRGKLGQALVPYGWAFQQLNTICLNVSCCMV